MRYLLTALFFFLSPSPASAAHSSNVYITISTPSLLIQWEGSAAAGPDAVCHTFGCSIKSTCGITPSNRFTCSTSLTMEAINIGIKGEASVIPGTADRRGVETSVLGTLRVSAAVPEGTKIRVSVSGEMRASVGDPDSTNINAQVRTLPHTRPGVNIGLGVLSTSYIVFSGPMQPGIGGGNFGFVDTLQLEGHIQTVARTAEASHASSFDGSFEMRFEVLGKTLTLATTVPLTAPVGTVLPLRARVIDNENGEGVDGVVVSFGVSSAPAGGTGAGTLRGPQTTTGGGYVENEVRLGIVPGTYTVTVACGECVPPGLFDFELTATGQSRQTVDLQEVFCDGTYFENEEPPYPLRVRAVERASMKPVPGLTVNFSLVSQPGGAMLLSSSTVTDAAGIARARLKLGGRGPHSIKASCADCGGNTSVLCPIEAITKPQSNNPLPDLDLFKKKTDITVSIAPELVAPEGTGTQVNQPEEAEVAILGTPNADFTATVQAIPNSGGHQHDANRPTGVLSTPTQTGRSVTIKADAEGRAVLTYRSGPAGGEEMIVVGDQDGKEGSAFVFVRVLGMAPFPKSGPNHRSDTGDTEHPNFTYARQPLIDVLNVILSEYKNNVTSGTLIISINDLSLISGGVFDTDRKWGGAVKHLSHRTGNDVDINSRPFNIEKNRRINKDSQQAKELSSKIEEIITSKRLNCVRIREEPIHFRCPP